MSESDPDANQFAELAKAMNRMADSMQTIAESVANMRDRMQQIQAAFLHSATRMQEIGAAQVRILRAVDGTESESKATQSDQPAALVTKEDIIAGLDAAVARTTPNEPRVSSNV